MNELYQDLSKETEKLRFANMSDIFLNPAIEPNRPFVLDESKAYINALSDYSCPKDTELKNWPDKKISSLLMRVKRTKICKLKNDVVHKRGYRPKQSEAEHALKEVRSVLFPLTFLSNLHDEINWYCHGD